MPDTHEKKRFSLALNKGLQMLSRKNLSRKELRQKLLGKDFPQDIVEAVLKYCEERGYLDEREKALQIVRSSLRAGHGPLRIQREFTRCGLPEVIGENALKNFSGEMENHLEKTALKKLAAISEPDPRKKKAKLYRFLLGKGFSSSAIMDFIQKSGALFSEDHKNS
ncbi:recombination regulator RecX [Desulfococcaceae bacterium OttesenSCG-928-F15]|nr:recombination regulator RecX [Desulfococcaceae bacterium OttesenSCG-928-F15]